MKAGKWIKFDSESSKQLEMANAYLCMVSSTRRAFTSEYILLWSVKGWRGVLISPTYPFTDNILEFDKETETVVCFMEIPQVPQKIINDYKKKMDELLLRNVAS